MHTRIKCNGDNQFPVSQSFVLDYILHNLFNFPVNLSSTHDKLPPCSSNSLMSSTADALEAQTLTKWVIIHCLSYQEEIIAVDPVFVWSIWKGDRTQWFQLDSVLVGSAVERADEEVDAGSCFAPAQAFPAHALVISVHKNEQDLCHCTILSILGNNCWRAEPLQVTRTWPTCFWLWRKETRGSTVAQGLRLRCAPQCDT